jgi:subtilase family serine protease
MNRRISMIAVTAVVTGVAIAGVTGGGQAAAASAPQLAVVKGSAAPFTGRTTADGTVPASQRLTIQLWLAPPSAAATAAESYATDVAAPGNPLFQHYLSPGAYASRFGATTTQATAVANWLRSAGFTGIGADAGRDYVRATAPVSVINAALHTQLSYYRSRAGVSAAGHQLRANNTPVSVPADLAGDVLGVTGLDNAAPVMTYARPGANAAPSAPSFPCSNYYGQYYARNLPAEYGTTRFPTAGCGYSAVQLRSAYGYSPGDTGTGVTVALVEVGLAPYMFKTLQDYAAAAHIQAPSAGQYREVSLAAKSSCGDPFNVEEQLDVEASYVMAPGAKQVVVGGDSCDNGDFGLQALFDADTDILNGAAGRPLASIASNSWEGYDETQPANFTSIEHAYLVRAAAEGVGMYFSSGDSSGVLTPSSDPYAIAVGGTTLGIGKTNPHLFETGWSTGTYADDNGKWAFQAAEQGAGGGGSSLLWTQPAYQHGVVPAALAQVAGNRGGLVRALPDISADADPFTGFAEGLLSFDAKGNPTGYSESPIGGTSLAAPLVAGMVAAAQGGQGRTFGLIDPALYRLAGTGALYDPLPVTSKTPSSYRGVACDAADCGALALTRFDEESFAMTGYTGQVTRPGYDTMTGVGTPHGPAFISALRALEG